MPAALDCMLGLKQLRSHTRSRRRNGSLDANSLIALTSSSSPPAPVSFRIVLSSCDQTLRHGPGRSQDLGSLNF